MSRPPLGNQNNRLTGIASLTVALTTALVVGCGPSVSVDPDVAQRVPETVDFNFDVKPILSDRCYACHGPDANAREAELRLDTEVGALQAELRSGGRAFVPGSVRRSEAIRRLFSDDPGVVMPPPESNLSLSEYEKAVIVRWVDQGAEWKPHWSFIAPERPDVPDVGDHDWARGPIDRFILARLEREHLVPSAEARRERLLRRVTFDLTGLPPTIEEIDAFLSDDSENAYERVVDRLLASPTYGERMAADWLDLARYADSHGYQDDGMRNMWPWRDWVIEAFNRNMPYDEFVTLQLAGDLLPEPTMEQRLATGFNRNHLQSQEGGIVPEEYRVEYVADRTHTFGKAFLGLTVECGRCHDHKFDPISQAEYYELFAFFNSINEFGNIPYSGEASPTITLTSEDVEQELRELRGRMADLERSTDVSDPGFDDGFNAWRNQLSESRRDAWDPARGRVAYFPLDDMEDRRTPNMASAGGFATLEGDPDKSTITVEGRVGRAQTLVGDPFIDAGKEVGRFERNEPFSVALWIRIEQEHTEGPLFSRAGGLFNGKRGYVCALNPDGTLSASLNHVFPANSIEVRTKEAVEAHRWVHLAMTYDGSSRASGLRLYLDGTGAQTNRVADNLQHSILYSIDPQTGDSSNWGDSGQLRLGWLENNVVKLDSVTVDELMVYDRRLTALEIKILSGRRSGGLDEADHGRGVLSDADESALRDYYVWNVSPQFRRDFGALTGLRGKENAILTRQPQVMVMEELPEPRPTHILDRGSYDAPGDPVRPGTPSAVLEFGEDLRPDRLGLAGWLFDDRNPLTARVAVNRLWQQFFGTGLVPTPDDFGSQGARPTHPQLLDWLAVEFRESGWDLQSIQRMIVLSATYRQSSVTSPEVRTRDPDNRLLARGPSYRLPAEMIRDNALAASGLLVRRIGGPSVRPYQPAGLWKELATRNVTEYVQDHGDALYRRSMYTIWKRTTPPPSMISFDSSERNFCVVQRQKTSTPLQSLVLLNDPQYVEASRVLAERVTVEKEGAGDRIDLAFRLLTGRHPAEEERLLLAGLYEEQLEEFRSGDRRHEALLGVGEFPSRPGLDRTEVAAMTLVASTILNFDEAVMKR
jgi:hypothetical protein